MNQIKQGYKQTKVGIIPDDWEIVNFDELKDKTDRHSITGGPFGSDLKSEHYTSSGVRVIQLQNIGDGKYINKEFVYTSEEKANQLKNCLIYPNEIILAKMAEPVARACLIPSFEDKFLMCSDGIRLLVDKNKFSTKYVLEYINYDLFRKIAINRSTGSTRGRIGLTDLKTIPLALPPLKEQEKIAEVLTTWDKAITKQTELLEAKELLKIALMQKLLSGEVRFSGFSDEWEELRLGEIGEFKTSSIDKIINENESLVNLINYMDVYRNKHIDKNFRCSKTSLKEEQYEKVNLKKGDILFTPSSETPDDIGHSAVIIEDLPNTVYSYHLVRFRPKKSIDLKFSGYVFNNIDILKEFAKRANGSTRFTLSIKDFNETKAKLPSLLEQHKIAEVLSLVDDEINLLKNELEELKLQKKALMQKLLTGEVRVKV